MEDFGHDMKRKCAQVGQRTLPHLGKVRAQKWDKTRLKTTVSGEERQMPEAGTQRQYWMTVSVSNKIKELKEPVVLQGFTAQEKKE